MALTSGLLLTIHGRLITVGAGCRGQGAEREKPCAQARLISYDEAALGDGGVGDYTRGNHNNRSGPFSIQVNAPLISTFNHHLCLLLDPLTDHQSGKLDERSTPESERARIRSELLAKIGPPNVAPRPARDTCKWILNDDKFQCWRTSLDQHLLWVSGRPGKGKSYLAAFLGEQLSRQTTASSDPPLVLKYSCENNDIRRSTSLAVNLNLLYQILKFRRSDVALHEEASSILNDAHTSLNSNLPREELWEMIKGFANQQIGSTDRLTYLILDGLDECDAKSIQDLRCKLQQLCSTDNRQGKAHFKAVLLSRPLGDIEDTDICIDLDDETKYGERILDEIRLFIHDEMRPIFGTRETELENLKKTLSERSNKTFLWVSLALKLLKSHRSDLEAIVTGRGQHALDRLLPVGLPSMYNRMLLEALRGKYDGQGKYDSKSCAKTIQLICVAIRPLTLAELQGAVGPSSDVSTILSYCRHMIVQSSQDVDQENNFDESQDLQEALEERLMASFEMKSEERTFQLVHLSLKQYLQQLPKFTIPAPLGLLAWSPLSFIVDILRTAMHRFYYLDHILFAAFAFSSREFFKQYPAIGLVLVGLSTHGLWKLWMRGRSWITQVLLTVLEDFLGLCVYGAFAASERSSHEALFLRSITFLMDGENGLQQERDINLSRQGALSDRKPISVDDELAPFGQYASRFWTDHLCEVDWSPREKSLHGALVLDFLESHLLDWLRNLSMQNKLRDGTRSIKRLVRIFQARVDATTHLNRHDKVSRLGLFLRDTERFMMLFVPGIEQAPFQVYASALAFCPTSSLVRSTFRNLVLSFAENIKTTQDDWSRVLQVLEGRVNRVTSVAFSNDGKLIASASHDAVVHLWDLSLYQAVASTERDRVTTARSALL
ncbi:hypothetical protein EDB81DRAFT_858121 [Dactylonectria macrodidyma]|uniref:Nephrocystin 3-like N-terminal domain-containing protein n=1 Tax=Dactylonectria macrodidyma TaxID=307937 RepID=A0A9P9IZ13_9HYPO|nr:hypothetical protein EDB81DRAFT_858121 [Dactylonectria macrodidyma]